MAGFLCRMGLTANAQDINIALGKTVTLGPSANYGLTRDKNPAQLTDGIYAGTGAQWDEKNQTKDLWVQKGTLGWQNVTPVRITIDLGQVQPIAGASFSTAAGRADVVWPGGIYMTVSDDNRTWYPAGDLVTLSRKNAVPPAQGYTAFRYLTRDIKTWGRYITFYVAGMPYIFVDEIEVFAGDRQWINSVARGESIRDMKEYLARSLDISGVKRRLNKDSEAIQGLIKTAQVSTARRNQLAMRLNEQAARVDEIMALPKDFKAIVPLNTTHREIMAVYGELLAAQGVKPLTVWKQHRYAWLPLLVKPVQTEKNELNFKMLKNQFRSDALLLTNASAQARTVKLKLSDSPRGAQAGWLKIDAVEWTDTMQGDVVPSALIPVKEENGVYSITIPAGLTRKIWFTVDSSRLPAGKTNSILEITDGNVIERVLLALDISNIEMNKPRLSLGMWDYTNGDGLYGINPQNRDAAIELMRSHFVDTTWASSAALPRPEATAFDAQNNLQEKVDFTNLDQWIARWPGARRYFVYANAGDSFAGAKMGTPEFHARVGSWARAVSAHRAQLGLEPGQLGILLVDEPRTDAQDAIAAAWAKAIKATAPELTLFQDPIWERPDQTKIQEAITQADILCPMLPMYYRGGEPVKNYFANLRGRGKELWFYQCTGPTRTYDPQAYFRYQAWHTYSIGGTGQGFWSFGDTGRAASSWNEYSAGGVNYTPVFLEKDSVHGSVHWDAVREGMQDFEELSMLRDAISASRDARLKAEAEKVLQEAVATVTGVWSKDYSWQTSKVDPNLADDHLGKVRAMLEKL